VKRNPLQLAVIGLVSMLGGALLFNLLQPDSSTIPPASSITPIELHSIPLFDLSGQQTIIGDWKGDILIIESMDGIFPAKAKKVLSGGTSREEIIYKIKKNHYFISDMVLSKQSWVRNVYIFRAELPNTRGAK